MSIPKTTPFTLKHIVENLDNIPTKGFSDETPKLTEIQKKRLHELASMFESFGQALGKENSIMESANALSEFASLAKSYALNECGDCFQQEIVKNDMKKLDDEIKQYKASAQKCYAEMQKLGVMYENIRHISQRYYQLEALAESMPALTPQLAQKPTAMRSTTNETAPMI